MNHIFTPRGWFLHRFWPDLPGEGWAWAWYDGTLQMFRPGMVWEYPITFPSVSDGRNAAFLSHLYAEHHPRDDVPEGHYTIMHHNPDADEVHNRLRTALLLPQTGYSDWTKERSYE